MGVNLLRDEEVGVFFFDYFFLLVEGRFWVFYFLVFRVGFVGLVIWLEDFRR